MRRALWLLAGLLASAATAQVSVLSNPPGTGVGGASAWGSITGTLSSQTDLNSALAGKAKLSGGNSFSGAQAFDNTLSLTNAGTTADLHLNAASGADTLYFDFNGITYAHIGTNAALSWLVYDANVAHHFYINGADSLDLAATALDFHTGVGITNNGTSIINGSGVLQAAGFPALTGDVTTSAGSLATSIPSGTVTLAKMANMATSSLIYRKTAGSGAPEVNTLATLKTDLGLTGTNSGDQTITLTGDVTGTGTGSFATTLATVAGAIKSSGATAGIGYATGAGGAVTQLTSRATGVTCSKVSCGITLFSTTTSAGQTTSATVTNTAVVATDVIACSQQTGTGVYFFTTKAASGSYVLSVYTPTAVGSAEAPVINCNVVKGVAA